MECAARRCLPRRAASEICRRSSGNLGSNRTCASPCLPAHITGAQMAAALGGSLSFFAGKSRTPTGYVRPDPSTGRDRKPYSTCWPRFEPAASGETPVFPATWRRVPARGRCPHLSVPAFLADLLCERSCRKGFRGSTIETTGNRARKCRHKAASVRRPGCLRLPGNRRRKPICRTRSCFARWVARCLAPTLGVEAVRS
jgi:hypothetical protein